MTPIDEGKRLEISGESRKLIEKVVIALHDKLTFYHRPDAGYAAALKALDAHIAELEKDQARLDELERLAAGAAVCVVSQERVGVYVAVDDDGTFDTLRAAADASLASGVPETPAVSASPSGGAK